MIGDYWNKNGVETSMNTVVGVKDTRTETYPGMHIYTGGITDTKIPYSLVIDGGPIEISTGERRINADEFRISLLSPVYLQYTRLFTQYERDLFNQIMHREWEHILYLCHDYHTNWYDFGDILSPQSICPDYSLLEI